MLEGPSFELDEKRSECDIKLIWYLNLTNFVYSKLYGTPSSLFMAFYLIFSIKN